MEYKVAELEGALLDAAVARAEGLDATGAPWWPRYSVDWSHGGPIIETERITLLFQDDGTVNANVRATIYGSDVIASEGEADGPTPLIAAMRAYVASKFGETVELT